jgi:hypothetical protein
MLDAQGFAEALRKGVARSGLAVDARIAEAGYLSLAGTILAYLKENLEVTVSSDRIREAAGGASDRAEVECRIR